MAIAHLPGTWHELYVMLGTSSAALIGLLFVASSLHLAEVVNEEIYRLRAQYTALLLVGTLVQAAIVLTPQPMHFLGAELLATNVWGISVPLNLLYKAIRIRASGKRGGFSVYRAAYFIAGYVAGIAGSAALMVQAEWGMYLVTVCYVNCLIATIWNAWMIMLGIGRSAKKRAR
jgi:hypothetical protein